MAGASCWPAHRASWSCRSPDLANRDSTAASGEKRQWRVCGPSRASSPVPPRAAGPNREKIARRPELAFPVRPPPPARAQCSAVQPPFPGRRRPPAPAALPLPHRASPFVFPAAPPPPAAPGRIRRGKARPAARPSLHRSSPSPLPKGRGAPDRTHFPSSHYLQNRSQAPRKSPLRPFVPFCALWWLFRICLGFRPARREGFGFPAPPIRVHPCFFVVSLPRSPPPDQAWIRVHSCPPARGSSEFVVPIPRPPPPLQIVKVPPEPQTRVPVRDPPPRDRPGTHAGFSAKWPPAIGDCLPERQPLRGQKA